MMKFSDYDFKPSDVIEGLNAFYKKDEENKNCKCPPFSWRMGYSKYACHFFNIKTRDGELYSYKTFENDRLEEAITWLREECDIFYTPGMTWDDLKYKMPLKAAEKEYGTADIREMYPGCIMMVEARRAARKYSLKQFEKELGLKHLDLPWDLSGNEAEKVMNYCMNDVICTKELMREKARIDGQEALEGLRTLYYAVATKHERALRRLDECLNDDRDWPETSYMLEYIRRRVETADESIEYLCKENDDLRDQVQNLKDLINRIHEDSDI